MRPLSANFCGVLTIIMWSVSALLISYTGKVPAFLLASMVFGICSAIYLVKWAINKEKFWHYFYMSKKAYITVVCGVGGYISFYYMAFKMAPAMEVNLLNYLWPILMVITSAVILKNKLLGYQFLGIILGFIGVFLIFAKEQKLALNLDYLLGYIFAVAGALIWSIYSVVTRKIIFTPNNMAVFNIIFSILFFVMHKIFENTVYPNGSEWCGVILLGFTTTSYMLWDYAMKKGDVEFLVSLSYFIPLFSTLLLGVFYSRDLSVNIFWSAVFILSGCLIVNYKKIMKFFKI
ncbi:MAG: DMT family transporter [Alphaproteobacteria bacterium]